jgi:hypothetical protein
VQVSGPGLGTPGVQALPGDSRRAAAHAETDRGQPGNTGLQGLASRGAARREETEGADGCRRGQWASSKTWA